MLLRLLGVKGFSYDAKILFLKYLFLQAIVLTIFFSSAWISLYYLKILDSFAVFGLVSGLGMLVGAILDLPLGFVTDRFGQRVAFVLSMIMLSVYYFGLLFVKDSLGLFLLEVLVGLYSAFLSGSYTSWFMNEWGKLSSGNSFRNAISSSVFFNILLTVSFTLLGSAFLSLGVNPLVVFFFQSLICLFGAFVGFKIMKSFKYKREKFVFSFKHYTKLIPFFFGSGLLFSTSSVSVLLIAAPLVYALGSGVSFGANFSINLSNYLIFLIGIYKVVPQVIQAFSSRFSERFISRIGSSFNSLSLLFFLAYPLGWSLMIIVLLLPVSSVFKLLFVLLINFFRSFFVGSLAGLYWDVFSRVTNPSLRSSQESFYNTVKMITSTVLMVIVGFAVEVSNFVGGISILLVSSLVGFVIFYFSRSIVTEK